MSIQTQQFPKNFHFGGGAWASSFHIGVVKALEEQWEDAKIKSGGRLTGKLGSYMKISGDSVGSVIGAGVQLGINWTELRAIYMRLARQARKGGVWCGKMSIYHEEMLDCILKDHRSVEMLNKRGFAMGVTRFFNKYQKYTCWRNTEHLRECFHSSLHVPLYCSYKSGVDGRQAIDGGFSNTIKEMKDIEASAGRGPFFHISMSPTFYEIIYPPSDKDIDRKINEGYRATMAWKRGTPPLEISMSTGTCFMIFILLLRTIHFIFHIFEKILCASSRM
jgi:hypothetical protein